MAVAIAALKETSCAKHHPPTRSRLHRPVRGAAITLRESRPGLPRIPAVLPRPGEVAPREFWVTKLQLAEHLQVTPSRIKLNHPHGLPARPPRRDLALPDLQFTFPAACQDHDHLYDGTRVNNQVPPL
jgi:hypothetical protein